MPSYYKYKGQFPSALNDPNQFQWEWEDPADWPKTFEYVPAYSSSQGFHAPGPVYQSNQGNYYYYPANNTPQAGYYVNGYYQQPQAPSGWPYSSSYTYYPTTLNPFTYSSSYSYSPYATVQQGPLCYQAPWCASTATTQAAAALAANAALANMPNAPAYFVGATAAEVQAQNQILAMNMAAVGQPPSQLAPYKPSAGQQFWCKELDGSWTLREHNDVVMGELGQGHWERHPTSGYYFYVKYPA